MTPPKATRGLQKSSGLASDQGRKTPVTFPVLQKNTGEIVTDSKTKAKMVSDQYRSVFTDEDTQNIPDMEVSPHPSAGPLLVDTKGVEKQLEKLNVKKVVGPDLIPTRTVKDYRHHIAPIL